MSCTPQGYRRLCRHRLSFRVYYDTEFPYASPSPSPTPSLPPPTQSPSQSPLPLTLSPSLPPSLSPFPSPLPPLPSSLRPSPSPLPPTPSSMLPSPSPLPPTPSSMLPSPSPLPPTPSSMTPSPSPLPPTSYSPPPSPKSDTTALFMGALISALMFLVLMTLVLLGVIHYKQRKRRHSPQLPSQPAEELVVSLLVPSSIALEHSPVLVPSSIASEHSPVLVPSSIASDHSPVLVPSSIASDHSPVLVPSSIASEHSPVVLPSSIAFEQSPSKFTCEELELATDRFSDSNFLGQGGFGTVHKGFLPYNNQSVAIKQLKAGSKQGMREFQTEVNVISKVHHRHLVTLVGYGIAESHSSLMLVYEFVPNKTLDFHLHGSNIPSMNWTTRMKIAIGSAKGLAYLHEDCQPKIIHRDIKAANILLESDFQPKIADFGLAKLSSDTDTHVSTSRIKGTFGYLAPEYANSGKLSEKADVFSFGVVLLELITGRKPVLQTGSFTDDSLVEWARPLLMTALGNRNFEVLADPRLHNNYNSQEMFRMASCAANCVRHSADHRPRMSQVVDALAGKICLDNWNNDNTQADNKDLNKFWKRAVTVLYLRRRGFSPRMK